MEGVPLCRQLMTWRGSITWFRTPLWLWNLPNWVGRWPIASLLVPCITGCNAPHPSTAINPPADASNKGLEHQEFLYRANFYRRRMAWNLQHVTGDHVRTSHPRTESRRILSPFATLQVCSVVAIDHVGDYVLFPNEHWQNQPNFQFLRHNNIHVRRLCYLGGSDWSWLPSTRY